VPIRETATLVARERPQCDNLIYESEQKLESCRLSVQFLCHEDYLRREDHR